MPLQRLSLLLLLIQVRAEERTIQDCPSNDGTCGKSKVDFEINTSTSGAPVNDQNEEPVGETTSTSSETTSDSTTADADSSSYYETSAGRMRIPDPPLSNTQCNLFMAESAIPFAGWGMYTGIPLKKGTVVQPLDLAIQVQDQTRYQARINEQPFQEKLLPDWLMEQYYWNARVTYADYDAKSIDSIIPSFGMLANSHTGLVNLRNKGCRVIEKGGDGSQTVYRDQSFTMLTSVEAGHELFADYGDQWFTEREDTYGPMPLSKDWKQADKVLEEFNHLCAEQQNITDFCQDLWHLVKVELKIATPDRLVKALPEDLEDISRYVKEGTAKSSLPNVVRSLDWLFQNGMCLDHMESNWSDVAGMGAFAKRPIPRGSLVAPAPLIHMHRDHLAVLITDRHDVTKILWRGHQLLLNYCYGHPSSSLLLFPYSPVVNFINHSSEKPNVKLQWSSKMSRKEWLHSTTHEVLQNDHSAGLMMEFVALRDIEVGEEILYDYGPAFEQAIMEFEDEEDRDWFVSEDFDDVDILPTENDKQNPLPKNLMTVCWVPDVDDMKKVPGKPKTYKWATRSTEYFDQTSDCWIEKVVKSRPPTYNVRYKLSKKETISVQGLPRRAIAVVDRPYTKAQYRRHTFRHEIHLPDEMIPVGWRDREAYSTECGLYMAESSIPHSGLGMYTAREIDEGKYVFHGDVVVQVADFKVNRKLRHWYHGTNQRDEADWLLANYFWNSDNTLGVHEAGRISSIVPGMGMLANSHTGLINSGMRRPTRESGGIHRSTHPSAGSSTTFHDLTFAVFDDLAPGTELFVEYGDRWFRERKDLGLIPLSKDFKEADKILKEFYRLVGHDIESEMAVELWEFFWNTSSAVEDSRVRNALPRDLKRVPEVLKSGTAKHSVPNQIRPLEWLKHEGICLDNIKSGPSRIEGAHRGAFATRPLKEGQVIAPMPVAHIRRQHLEIYDSEDIDNKTKVPWFDGHQQLLNYCFGHANSSVLLFPYSPVVNYVNHSPKSYNSELRWSKLPTQRQEFKEMFPDKLMTHDHAGLILELVATQDIGFGEEILLNYGERWEQAWSEWVQSWRSNDDDQDYTPAFELNDYLTPVRTQAEQKKNPYPDNVITICFASFSGKPIEMTKNKEPVYNWEYSRLLYETTDDAYTCEILGRSKDEMAFLDDTVAPSLHTYTVKINMKKGKAVIRQVPRRAIEFFDDEYTSDLTLTRAFRHEIGLPDHLLPPAWADYAQPIK